jgi:preprotein translocase subunit SecD
LQGVDVKKAVGWKIGLLLPVMMGAATASQAAEINLSSATDFTRMDVLLKDDDRLQSTFEMNVTLSPEATERMQNISRASLGQQLTLSINGWKVSTATVQSVLGSQFRVSIPKAVAKDLLPTLVD